MFYGLFHTVPGHSGLWPKTILAWNSMFRPLSRSFILALGVHLRFGNSLADYINKLLVGQGCFLR